MTSYLTDLVAILLEHPSLQVLKFLNYPPASSKQTTIEFYTGPSESSPTEWNYRTITDILARNASKPNPILLLYLSGLTLYAKSFLLVIGPQAYPSRM